MATGRTGSVGRGASEDASAPERLQVGARIAGFALTARLSQAPLTEIWAAGRIAASRHLPNQVVLRIARRGFEAEAEPLLKREYEVLRALEEDARAPLALGYVSAGPALVMAHVDSVTLEEVLALAEEGLLVLGLGTALDIGLALANALRAAHSTFRQRKRVFHGRLSPSQILVDDRGELTVLGFGREIGEPPPVPFRPPERLTERPLDDRTDQWSLGAIITELACATLRDASPAPRAARILGVPPALARKLAWIERVHPGLGEVLRRTMAYDPNDRFQPESALGKALLRYASELSPPRGRGQGRAALVEQVRPHSAFLRRALETRRQLNQAEHLVHAERAAEEKPEGMWVRLATSPPLQALSADPPLELGRKSQADEASPIFLPNGATDIDESGEVSVYEESALDALTQGRASPRALRPPARRTNRPSPPPSAEAAELRRAEIERLRRPLPTRRPPPTVTDLPPLPPDLPRPVPRGEAQASLAFWLRVLGLMILLGVLVGVLL